MKEVTVNVEAGTKELVIRQGSAIDAKAPKSINIIGTLGAPFQFATGKVALLDPNNCHLKINKHDGELIFVAHDTDPYTTHTISGKLSVDKNLQSFNINTDKRWEVREFLDFIKMNRFFFADRAAHAVLVNSLQKWHVKVERVFNDLNDNKGNSNFQIETKVREVELLSEFDLNMPIFAGFPKKKFKVEIGIEPRNVSVSLYLISDELMELMMTFREQLIDSAVEDFKDFGCSKIVIA